METYGLQTANGTSLPKVWAHSQLRDPFHRNNTVQPWVHELQTSFLYFIIHFSAVPQQLLSGEWKKFWWTSVMTFQSVEGTAGTENIYRPSATQASAQRWYLPRNKKFNVVHGKIWKDLEKRLAYSRKPDICKFGATGPFLSTCSP